MQSFTKEIKLLDDRIQEYKVLKSKYEAGNIVTGSYDEINSSTVVLLSKIFSKEVVAQFQLDVWSGGMVFSRYIPIDNKKIINDTFDAINKSIIKLEELKKRLS